MLRDSSDAILSLGPNKTNQLVHTMSDQSVISVVIDYAKRKSPDGTYDIVIFELQNDTVSKLILPDKHDEDREVRALQTADVYRALLKSDASIIVGKKPFSDAYYVNELLKNYSLLSFYTGPNPFFYPLGTLFYHTFDFAFKKHNLINPIASKYRNDALSKQLLSSKVMQRVWLNLKPSTRKFLPGKVMIVDRNEIDGSSESLNQLVKKIINVFGEGGDIYLKSNSGCVGSGNIRIQIIDEETLRKELLIFCQKRNIYRFFTIEETSFLGQSIEKNHVDSFRLVGILIKDNKQQLSFNAINLWHTYTNNKNEIDSHEYLVRRNYYLAGKHVILPSAANDNVENKITQLSPDTIHKNLDMETNNKALFAEFRTLFHELSIINLADAIQQTPIYNFDPMTFETTKVVFSSENAKNLVLTHAKEMFAAIDNIKKICQKSYSLGFTDGPLEKIKLDAEDVEPRDWNLIAQAILSILDPFIEDFQHGKINDDNFNYKYNEIEKKLIELVYHDAKYAEKKARSVILGSTIPGYQVHGTFKQKNRDKELLPKPENKQPRHKHSRCTLL